MSWYSTGTVAVANGSATVTGTGTAWVGNVVAGQGLVLQGGTVTYEITAVISDTQLTVKPVWQGSTQSGQTYQIVPIRGFERAVAAALAASMAQIAGYIDGPLAGRFGDGTAGAPGMAFAGQTNTGLARLGASILALSINGTERMRWTTTGAQLTGLLTGTAVTQSTTDTTAGRVLRTRDGGLLCPPGVAEAAAATRADLLVSGFSRTGAGTTNNPFPQVGSIVSLRRAADAVALLCLATTGSQARLFLRHLTDSETEGPLAEFFSTLNVLGTVSQSGGVPTGAVIQRGSNANGQFTRFASGLQICRLTINAGARNAFGSGTWADPYRTSALTTQSFPAAFSSTPAVEITPSIDSDTAAARALTASVQSVSSTAIQRPQAFAIGDDTSSANVTLHIYAIGNWFDA